MLEGCSRPHIINSIYKRDFFFRLAATILKVSFNSAPPKQLDISFYSYNESFKASFCKSSLITSDYMKANKEIYFRLTQQV